jgi:hypothetical protein
MVPQRIGLFLVAWFFARIQHPKDVLWEQTPFQTTVRIVCSRVADVLLLGQARHCLHHLAPSIPYYRYHRAWAIGEQRFETQNVPTRTLWAPIAEINMPDMAVEEPIAPSPESSSVDSAFEVELASSGEVLIVGPDEFFDRCTTCGGLLRHVFLYSRYVWILPNASTKWRTGSSRFYFE